MAVFTPASAREIGEVVAWAAAEEQPIEIIGGGSKRRIGRMLQVEHLLDLSRLTGNLVYEPAELVLTAAAATPLAEIEAALDASGQMLAFEPVDWRAILDSEDKAQTIGGVIACNLAGPRRIKSGAPRDHFLGFEAINGRGEVFIAGGKVVKNVTGYDLCKLMAGSYGSLAVMSEVTLKVLPRPSDSRTVVLLGLSDADAIKALANGLNSPHEVSGAAHLPAGVTRHSGVASIASAGQAVTLLRIEGPPPSVAHRSTALAQELGAGADLDHADTGRLWREIGDAALIAAPRDRAIWRVSVAPSAGPGVAAAIRGSLDAELYYDWAGGLVWIAIAGDVEDCGGATIREAITANGGGHATLIRASDNARAVIAVFEPLAAPLAALSARVKESFDPRRVLNPGRMYPGV